MLFLLTTNGLTKHLGTSSSQPLKNPAQTHGQSSFCMLTADHFSWIDASGSPLRESENESVANVSWTNPEKKRQKNTPNYNDMFNWLGNQFCMEQVGFQPITMSVGFTLLEATKFWLEAEGMFSEQVPVANQERDKKKQSNTKTLNQTTSHQNPQLKYHDIYISIIYIYESYGKLQHTSETNT